MIKRKRRTSTGGSSLKNAKVEDSFESHFCRELEATDSELLLQDRISSPPSTSLSLQGVGSCQYEPRASGHVFDVFACQSFEQLGLPTKLLENFNAANKGAASERQVSIFNVIGKYIDLYNISPTSEHVVLYCLHALNHIIKTKNLVISNNLRLQELREKGTLTEEEIERARDQGFARPKVLILCPMKKDAYEIVEYLRALIFGESSKPFVTNADRFKSEFGDNGYRISEKRVVSDEYRDLMSGNNDDCFRLGIGIAKKSLKLYVPFVKSDILIASPLGLRIIVGEESEAAREIDFLSSIEVLVIDKADVILMQNWEHLLHLIDSLHCCPEKLDVDVSRVRHWSLNQHAKLYRQTIVASSMQLAECRAIFALKCFNFAGCVRLQPPIPGLLSEIEVPVCQELQRFIVENPENQCLERFAHFKKKILPKCESGTVIFIPSYFDFVRIRNHLKKENESFVQLNEYAKQGKVAKARALFLSGEKKLMLVTERFHFFRRYFIKGIRSLVFYQPPAQPRFYHEFLNMISSSDRVLVRLLYSKFDASRMRNIFGDVNYSKLSGSSKSVHVLLSQ